MHTLTRKLRAAFDADERVPEEFADDLIARMDGIRIWRNALCHGAWQEFRESGSVGLRYFRRCSQGIERLENRVAVDDLSAIRTEAANFSVDLADIVLAAGIRFPGTTVADLLRNNQN